MNFPKYLFLPILIALVANVRGEENRELYELRTYYAAEGKLDDLHARFRDHTVALFKKHGMTNLVYWTPRENESNTLVYLLRYPDAEARERSWRTFGEDPEWKEAKAESTRNGKLIEKVESVFLEPTDYSPAFPTGSADEPRLFEMRRYTTNPDKLDELDARFRDHTIALFKKHGMTNVAYFHPTDGEENSENVLLYFLVHENEETRNAGFKAFSRDPVWKSARDESEKDGKLLIEKGVESTFLVPTDYSPLQ